SWYAFNVLLLLIASLPSSLYPNLLSFLSLSLSLSKALHFSLPTFKTTNPIRYFPHPSLGHSSENLRTEIRFLSPTSFVVSAAQIGLHSGSSSYTNRCGGGDVTLNYKKA
ncbi:hypothetical protein F2P56_004805, partial [Juglans regia]